MDRPLPIRNNRLKGFRANWTWGETVDLIDYVEERKNDGILWSSSQREHLSSFWTKKELSCSTSVYKYGWSAMKASCSREVLLSNPSNTGMPEQKERKARVTEAEALTNWSLNYDASRATTAADINVSASDHTLSLSPSALNLGHYQFDSLQQAIQNPAQYLSDLGQIQRLEKRLLTDIGKAVDTLLVESRTEKHRQPLLQKVFESPAVPELLSIVYGTTTERELQQVLGGERSQSYLELVELLEVLLASAITVWVLLRQHHRLPQDPSQRKLTPTEIFVRNALPAAIEQGLRHERFLSVEKKTGWETCIDSLTTRFNFGIMPFLEQNIADFAKYSGQWLKSLQIVFATALDIDGQLLLWPRGVHVDWPKYGEPYDPVLMRPVNNDDGTGKNVRAALFPAVVEKQALLDGTLQGDSSEGILFRAKVILQ